MTHSESLPGPAASATHGVADNQENSGSCCTSCWIAAETRPCAPWRRRGSWIGKSTKVSSRRRSPSPVRGDAILSSGYAALNDALGCMGYPQGCVVEWIADADAGLPLLAGLCRALTAEGRYLALTDSAGSFARPLGPGAKGSTPPACW